MGDKHEDDGRNKMGQSANEENMDKWNNAEGRKIAQKITKDIGNWRTIKTKAWSNKLDDIIAKETIIKLQKGDLITKPNDSRQYKDTRTTSQKLSDEIKAKYYKIQEERRNRYPVFGNKNNSVNTNSDNGHWVTINGRHIFIN